MDNLIIDEENEDETFWKLHRFYKRKFLNYFNTEKNLDTKYVAKILRAFKKNKLNSIKNHYDNVFRKEKDERK